MSQRRSLRLVSRARGSAFDAGDVRALTAAGSRAVSLGTALRVDRLSWATGEVSAAPDGGFEARVWPWPVHARVDGRWVDLDDEWDRSGRWLSPQVSAVPFRVRAEAGDGEALIRVGDSGGPGSRLGVAAAVGDGPARTRSGVVDYGRVEVTTTPLGPLMSWPTGGRRRWVVPVDASGGARWRVRGGLAQLVDDDGEVVGSVLPAEVASTATKRGGVVPRVSVSARWRLTGRGDEQRLVAEVPQRTADRVGDGSVRALVGLWAVNAMSLYRGTPNEKPDMTSTTLAAGGRWVMSLRRIARICGSTRRRSTGRWSWAAGWRCGTTSRGGVARRRTCWCSG